MREGEQLSQELRLTYDNDGPVTAFVGVSYYSEEGFQRTPAQFNERVLLARLAGALNGGGLIPGRPATDPAPAALFNNNAFMALLLQGAAAQAGYALPGPVAGGIAANLKANHSETTTNTSETEAFDIFADVTFEVSDRFELGIGARYAHDDKSTAISSAVLNGRSILGGFIGALQQPEPVRTLLLNALAVPGAATIPPSALYPVPLFGLTFQPTANNGDTFAQDLNDSSFTWRLTARYEPGENSSIYASYARGRRPEVLSALPPATPFGAARFNVVDAETVDSFELGARTQTRELLLDGALFYYRYDNFQTTVQQGTIFVTTNAGEATAYGFEGQVRWRPSRNVTLFGTYAWNHSRFSSGVRDGNRFRLSPDHTISLGGQFGVDLGPGRIEFVPSVTYQSRGLLRRRQRPAGPADRGLRRFDRRHAAGGGAGRLCAGQRAAALHIRRAFHDRGVRQQLVRRGVYQGRGQYRQRGRPADVHRWRAALLRRAGDSTLLMSLSVDRRLLLKAGTLGLGALAVPGLAQALGARGFTHGVASGEPRQNSVMLWTRYVPAAGASPRLSYQVSTDADFGRIEADGTIAAEEAHDFCVKPVVEGLRPGRWYWYRFRDVAGDWSPAGRTRTLPEGRVREFRIALFSCSNLRFGWFNAYAHAAARRDIDLVVHVGDYLYEYQEGRYPAANEALPGRTILPASEIVRLADYRLRYAAYRADPDLQRLHQMFPMISMWDDHETANDAWEGGAQNHQPDQEGRVERAQARGNARLSRMAAGLGQRLGGLRHRRPRHVVPPRNAADGAQPAARLFRPVARAERPRRDAGRVPRRALARRGADHAGRRAGGLARRGTAPFDCAPRPLAGLGAAGGRRRAGDAAGSGRLASPRRFGVAARLLPAT